MVAKDEKIAVGLAVAGAVVVIGGLVWYLIRPKLPPVPECTCTDWTKAECVNGKRKYVRTCTPRGCDSETKYEPDPTCEGPIECAAYTDQASCIAGGCQWIRETETSYPWVGARKCLSKADYPYTCEEPTCRMGFRTREEYEWHRETFHPYSHIEHIDGVGLLADYCGVRRAGAMTFNLPHERYTHYISGKLAIGGSAPWGATCKVKVGFYIDETKVYEGYAGPGVHDFTINVGKVCSLLYMVLEEISYGCCTYLGADPPYFAWGSMAFTVGLV